MAVGESSGQVNAPQRTAMAAGGGSAMATEEDELQARLNSLKN
jgi:hypothetical protein